MDSKAIVYCSKNGHTKQYAELFGKLTGLCVYDIKNAAKCLKSNTPVLYFGWIRASVIVGFKKATQHFNVIAVAGVGLSDSDIMIDEVKNKTKLPPELPFFKLQGGICSTGLKGMDKVLINLLVKGLRDNKNRSEQDDRMLRLMENDANFVSEDNLQKMLEWYNKTI